MKHFRNSNLKSQAFSNHHAFFETPLWGIQCQIKSGNRDAQVKAILARGFCCGVVARSHLARTPAGKVLVCLSLRFSAPNCRLRSAWGSWLEHVSDDMALCCSVFSTLTLFTLPSVVSITPSTLTADNVLLRDGRLDSGLKSTMLAMCDLVQGNKDRQWVKSFLELRIGR